MTNENKADKTKQRDIPAADMIQQYFHCAKCVKEWQASEEINSKMSPATYQKIQIGFTAIGIQVWCNRHNCNIVHIDFEGQKHPANMEPE